MKIPSSDSPSLSRRHILGGAVASVAALTTAACSDSQSKVGSSRGQSKLPTYMPFTGLKPDIPATDTGVPGTFYRYPQPPRTFAKVPIGAGERITTFTPAQGLGTPKERSPWWRNLQDTLNIQLEMIQVPAADLAAKQAAMIAGGDIPDIAIVNPYTTPVGALEKYFTDLGPYLAGDAVKEYPALASISPFAWKTPTMNGTLFGVPQPRIAAGYTFVYRKDILDKRGITVAPTSGEELLDLLKDLTDAKNNVWAMGQDPTLMLRIVMEMLGVANGINAWMEKNGKFTSMYEAEETKEALNIVATLWRDGLFHPDSVKGSAAWFPGGTVLTTINDFVIYPNYPVVNPGVEIGFVPMPKWGGGGLAVKQLNAGASGNFAAFKKSSDTRTKQLLAFANYLAAPFGTAEYLTANVGKEGVSYNVVDGELAITDAGRADTFNTQTLGYICAQNYDVLYSPKHPDHIKAAQEFLTKVMAKTYFNPAIGLYSPTNFASAGLVANKKINDMTEDIMQNRRPVSEWDDAVKEWKNNAGDKMRVEYEKEFARNK